MPESTRISIDLRNVDNWVAEDKEATEIQSSYKQKASPPKIGWTINTIPTPEGVRSSNIFHKGDLQTEGFNSQNTDNLFITDHLMDVKGNLAYLYEDGTITGGENAKLLLQTPEYTLTSLLVADASGVDNYMHKRYTLFQNRTIFMIGFGDAVPLAGGVQPDFADVDLEGAVSVTRYDVTGTSLNKGDKHGIASWGNYVLLWNSTTVFWSDPNVFTEFTVGGSSLAGNQKIAEARGNILTIVPNESGFIIYCQENIISATYSGDAVNPWIFLEVEGSEGIMLLDAMPLVTRNENTSVQIAYTARGLVAVTSETATLLPEKINSFLASTIKEDKAVGSALITRTQLSPPEDKRPTVKNLFLYGDTLFVCTGFSEFYNPDIVRGDDSHGKMYIFDLKTGKLGIQEGLYVSVTPAIRFFTPNSAADLANKSISDNNAFQVTRRVSDDVTGKGHAWSIMDMGGQAIADVTKNLEFPQDEPRKAEIFIGSIAFNPDSYTEVISVKLKGSTMLVSDNIDLELAAAEEEASRAEVYAYSELRGDTNPVQFIYNPATDLYVGFVVGREVQVEVRGHNFYLTDIEIEVQEGGDL